MAKLQLTLPGRRNDDGTVPASLDPIRIDLDYQDGEFGRAISLELFQQMVKDYSTQPDLKDDEKIFFTVDKQLLHILLASTKCHSLALCKCKRKDGSESIAFVALDKNGKILGTKTNPTSRLPELADEDSDISSGEWIQGLTKQEAIKRGIIAKDPITDNFFDFGKYLSSIQKKSASSKLGK